MTENLANYLARLHPNYYARKLSLGWVVWDKKHDDEVVFTRSEYTAARRHDEAVGS